MASFNKFAVLFERGFKQAIRPYLALMPEFLMPPFYFVINSAAFQKVIEIPGFDQVSYLQFYAPVALLIAIFVSSGATGLEVVTDISTGFMDRIFLTPVNRWFIVFSKLFAVGLKSTLLVAIMMGLLILFGASFHGGILGLLLIFLISFIFAMGWAGIGLFIAFTTKNPRVLQSSFILFFPFSFITTSQLPLSLLSGWYKTAVQANPVTYILEAIRSVLIQGQINSVYWVGLLVAVGFALITLSLSAFTFKRSIIR